MILFANRGWPTTNIVMDGNKHEQTTLEMSAARSITLIANQCIKGHCPLPIDEDPTPFALSSMDVAPRRRLYTPSQQVTQVGYLFYSVTIHASANLSVRELAGTPLHQQPYKREVLDAGHSILRQDQN
ncbi:hypothetical protein L195_g020580 [Trifolium pratense]|uniref:Uncharacterized protein n=1 Tax=Trifolium pratense TaxID=57577 RepID=A0A2K3N2U6_TRIPR|nr:hypothetical protein L195_g020580 [Trifolium pratense]